MDSTSKLRRTLPYVAGFLLLFVGTSGTSVMFTWYVCAAGIGLGVWQLWMRRARLWWTWLLFASVAVYWLAWRQPFPLVVLLAWIFVLVALVAEAGRTIGILRGSKARP